MIADTFALTRIIGTLSVQIIGDGCEQSLFVGEGERGQRAEHACIVDDFQLPGHISIVALCQYEAGIRMLTFGGLGAGVAVFCHTPG